jgi:hypothetical protein
VREVRVHSLTATVPLGSSGIVAKPPGYERQRLHVAPAAPSSSRPRVRFHACPDRGRLRIGLAVEAFRHASWELSRRASPCFEHNRPGPAFRRCAASARLCASGHQPPPHAGRGRLVESTPSRWGKREARVIRARSGPSQIRLGRQSGLSRARKWATLRHRRCLCKFERRVRRGFDPCLAGRPRPKPVGGGCVQEGVSRMLRAGATGDGPHWIRLRRLETRGATA